MQTMECNLSRTEAETLATWLAAARQTGTEDTYAGKRAHPRITWCVPVRVEPLDGGEPAGGQYAYACDISFGGMGLRCRQPIGLFSRVRVTLDETGESLCGQVRHCTEMVTGYLMGIQFESQGEGFGDLRKSA